MARKRHALGEPYSLGIAVYDLNRPANNWPLRVGWNSLKTGRLRCDPKYGVLHGMPCDQID